MTLEPRGYEYPTQRIRVVSFPKTFADAFTQPLGFTEGSWPTLQIEYLGNYLTRLDCKTVLIENHYVDRDFVDDAALFYSRSLRGYPNYCQRLHFFSDAFDQEFWCALQRRANHGELDAANGILQRAYLGCCVVRPLQGSLIGRTVLVTLGPDTPDGLRRQFDGVRYYTIHVGGFEFRLQGLAFQQQDQGVSACATTALWSALHKVAAMEGLPLATPAAITQAASRYFMAETRPLPSEGLTIEQVCEATRAAGLAPIVVRGLSVEQARAELHTYLQSGFPPVLALKPIGRGDGHAVCAVGLKLGAVLPRTDPTLKFVDASSAVQAVYIHDDRLGPYAVADILPHTHEGQILPVLDIRWHGEPTLADASILRAIIVPAPIKLRLTATRMRGLGRIIAQGVGGLIPELKEQVQLACRYRLGTEYVRRAFDFGLSDEGMMRLSDETVLSRYVGEIQISGPDGPLFDVLLDATETDANPSVLVAVRRGGLSKNAHGIVDSIARRLGAPLIT